MISSYLLLICLSVWVRSATMEVVTGFNIHLLVNQTTAQNNNSCVASTCSEMFIAQQTNARLWFRNNKTTNKPGLCSLRGSGYVGGLLSFFVMPWNAFKWLFHDLIETATGKKKQSTQIQMVSLCSPLPWNWGKDAPAEQQYFGGI